MAAYKRKSKLGIIVETLRRDELVSVLAAENDCASAAHVVITLYEVDFVLVSLEQRKERIFEIFGGLAHAFIKDDQGCFHSWTVSDRRPSASKTTCSSRACPIP
ncbi:hypothetical protein [uncultured Ruegeria sp.]|uniref:hypothetical protein n=1 Tax=uncultured Ruegeria sp. TaxID=259304 RepID=UPI00262CB077|nr:hypothetical protein [uncultured Ruegeria sp.]